MANFATAKKIKHPFQTLVETTEGEFPTSGNFTAFPVATIELDVDGQYVDVGQIGPEDLLALIKGNKISKVRISSVLNADTWNLLKWACQKIDFDTPTNTPAESRSGLFSVRFGANVNYIKILGMKPVSGSPKIDAGKPDEFSAEFECVDVVDPTTTAPTVVVLATAFPSGTVYYHKNASLVFNGQTITFKTLTLTANRGTQAEVVAGQENPYGVQAYELNVAGSFTALWGVNSSPLTDFNADTKGSMVITFHTDKTLTFNAKLTKQKISVDNGAKGAVPQAWDFKYVDGMTVSA